MAKQNKQAPGDNPGYIYLAQRDDGLYKIGHSQISETRIVELRRQCGWRSVLIWKLACIDKITTERALHMRYEAQHDAQEWFNLSAADVEWLTQQTEASICEGYDPTTFIRLDAVKKRWYRK